MTHGAGKNLPEAIKGLGKFIKKGKDGSPSVLDKLKTAGFSTDNISSMTHGAGKNLPEAIKGLKNFIKPGEDGSPSTFDELKEVGFSTKNISSMMNGAGKNLPEAINGLENFIKPGEDGSPSTFDELKEVGFLTDNISSIMNGAGQRISKVESQLKKYLKKDKNGASDLDHITLVLTPSEISNYLESAGLKLDKKLEELKKMRISTKTLPKRSNTKRVVVKSNLPNPDETMVEEIASSGKRKDNESSLPSLHFSKKTRTYTQASNNPETMAQKVATASSGKRKTIAQQVIGEGRNRGGSVSTKYSKQGETIVEKVTAGRAVEREAPNNEGPASEVARNCFSDRIPRKNKGNVRG